MKTVITSMITAVIAAAAVVQFTGTGAESALSASVYDKIKRTGVLNCGYFIEAPFTMRDAQTGEMSGIAVDLTNMIAADLGVTVNWHEEMSFATFGQDLNNKRYDMVCGGIFILARSGVPDYTIPYGYVHVNGYVQAGNTAFDRPRAGIDWRGVRIAGIDGEGATTAVQKVLPEANLTALPQLSHISEMLTMVSHGKTDIAFVMPSVFDNYNATNPGKLKPAALGGPLYTYAISFALARDEYAFKSVLNNLITQYAVSGELGALFEKYDPKGLFDYPTK